MQTFECKNCGHCCSKFGKEKNFLPIYDWELESIKKLDTENKTNTKPTTVFLDLLTKKYFAVIYGIHNSPCIFLENNKCTIYEKRPFVCRTFPMLWTAKLIPDRIFDKGCFGFCKNDNSEIFLQSLTKKPYTLKEISAHTKKIYGKCYDHCLNSNKINLYLTKLLIKLEEKNKIKLKRISYDELTPEIIKSCSPLFDFLIDEEIISENKKNKLTTKFNNLKNLIKLRKNLKPQIKQNPINRKQTNRSN